MPNDINDYLEIIKEDIISHKCVLILGPELYIKGFDEKILERKEYFKSLENEIPGITFFEKDELFRCPTGTDNLKLERKIKDYYKGEGDLKLLELLSSIRFPLILNASPDEALEEFLQPKDKDVKFDYFQGGIDSNKDVKCDFLNPIVYSVFGKASERQSLIISHKQLYENIQQILPADSFPINIRNFIRSANSFLFLGFKFDSWCYQLLSYKILSGNEVRDRRIRLSSTQYEIENSVNIIMSSAVDMVFTKNSPAQLLENLFNLLQRDKKRSGFLRTIEKQEKYTSYLSYSRKDNQNPKLESIINVLLASLQERSSESIELKIIFDKRDLHFGQSIDSFMTRIGKGKTVILVISDKYFKSDYCMIEALRVHRYNNDDERIFIILIEDNLTLISNKIDKYYYKQYWKEKLSKLTTENLDPDKNKVIEYIDILKFIPDFIDLVESYNHFKIRLNDINENAGQVYRLCDSKIESFEKFVGDVINKMKKD